MTSEYEHSVASPVLTDSSQEHASRRHGRHTSDIEREIRHLRELLQLERQRADDAEERTRETLVHLKTINEARIKAVQEASQAIEELRLYKVQLETAQKEIFRAQDVLRNVDRQRLEAEKEAAELRTKNRKLMEEAKVQRAMEQGRLQGMKEGIEKGRELGLLEGRLMDNGHRPPLRNRRAFERDEPSTPSSSISSFTDPRPSTSRSAQPSPRPPSHARSVAHSTASRRSADARSEYEVPTPVPPPTSRHSSNQQFNHTAQTVSDTTGYSRPVSVRNRTPSPVHSPAFIPPDNYIPFVDADNVIRLPPPHEFHHSPSLSERPISPAHDSEADDGRQVNSRTGTPSRRSRRHSSPESNSTTISQLDLVNDPSDNHGLRTPMSVIPEVLSSQTSPEQPSGEQELSRRPSFTGSARTYSSQRSAMGATSQGTPAFYTRPRTTSGSTVSAVEPPEGAARMISQRSQSTLSSVPPISVRPPSSASGTMRSEPQPGNTPANRHPAPLPAEPPSFSMPSPPPEQADFPSPIILNSNELPANFVAMTRTPGSSVSRLQPLSYEANTSDDGPPVIPNSALFGMDSDSEGASSMDTLSTPPPVRRRLDQHQRRASGASTHYTAAQVPLPPSTVVGTPRSTRVGGSIPPGTPRSLWGGTSTAAGVPLPPSTVAGTPWAGSAVGGPENMPLSPSTAANTPRWGGSAIGDASGSKSRPLSRNTQRSVS